MVAWSAAKSSQQKESLGGRTALAAAISPSRFWLANQGWNWGDVKADPNFDTRRQAIWFSRYVEARWNKKNKMQDDQFHAFPYLRFTLWLAFFKAEDLVRGVDCHLSNHGLSKEAPMESNGYCTCQVYSSLNTWANILDQLSCKQVSLSGLHTIQGFGRKRAVPFWSRNLQLPFHVRSVQLRTVMNLLEDLPEALRLAKKVEAKELTSGYGMVIGGPSKDVSLSRTDLFNPTARTLSTALRMWTFPANLLWFEAEALTPYPVSKTMTFLGICLFTSPFHGWRNT